MDVDGDEFEEEDPEVMAEENFSDDLEDEPE